MSEGQLKGLVVLERLKEEVEHSSQSQEVLTGLVESKINMQRTAPARSGDDLRGVEAGKLLRKKHKLIKWEGERKRARTLQTLEASRAIGPWSGAHSNSSFGS